MPIGSSSATNPFIADSLGSITNPITANPLLDPYAAGAPSALFGNLAGDIRGQLGGMGQGAAGAGGRAASFLSKTPLLGKFAGSAPAEGVVGSAFGPGSIGRAGAYGIAGQLGSGLIRSAFGGEQDGNVDNFLEDAASYGGAGAGIGSLILPGVGTAVGAAAGVGVSAIKNFLFGGDSNDSGKTQAAKEAHTQDKQLNNLLTAAGLSPEAAGQIRLQILTSNTGVEDKELIKANYAAAIQAIPQIAAQEQQQRQQLSGLLATQQMLAPQFDTFLKNLGADQDAFKAANNEYADQLSTMNPAFGGYLKANAAQSVLSNAATAAAYKAQLGGQTAQMASQIGAPQSITDQLMAQYG